MTASNAFPTPHTSPSGPDCAGCDKPHAVTVLPPLTIHDVYRMLLDHRAAVHEALQELRASGTAVNVPFDAVFLCELAGLVVDLETGQVTGMAEDRVAPTAELRARLREHGFDIDGAAAA
jgi:hypothetical protein